MRPGAQTQSGFPAPHLRDPYAQAFYAYCAGGELRMQRCRDCGTWRHPPRVACAVCGSFVWEWSACAGTGTLYSWTVTVRPLLASLAAVVPYVPAIIELTERVRMASRLIDVPNERLRAGLPVRVAFVPVDGAVTVPVFRLGPD
jgi:hypothetical protein